MSLILVAVAFVADNDGGFDAVVENDDGFIVFMVSLLFF